MARPLLARAVDAAMDRSLVLGYTTIGVVLVLMSTVGVFLTFGLSAIAAGIWGLVEGILILVGSGSFRTDARGIPLRD